MNRKMTYNLSRLVNRDNGTLKPLKNSDLSYFSIFFLIMLILLAPFLHIAGPSRHRHQCSQSQVSCSRQFGFIHWPKPTTRYCGSHPLLQGPAPDFSGMPTKLQCAEVE